MWWVSWCNAIYLLHCSEFPTGWSRDYCHAGKVLHQSYLQQKVGNNLCFCYRELSEGRVPEDERQDHPVLKKYLAGEPCERLYVKNLAKQTTEDELKYIFGRWDLNVSTIVLNVVVSNKYAGHKTAFSINTASSNQSLSLCKHMEKVLWKTPTEYARTVKISDAWLWVWYILSKLKSSSWQQSWFILKYSNSTKTYKHRKWIIISSR